MSTNSTELTDILSTFPMDWTLLLSCLTSNSSGVVSSSMLSSGKCVVTVESSIVLITDELQLFTSTSVTRCNSAFLTVFFFYLFDFARQKKITLVFHTCKFAYWPLLLISICVLSAQGNFVYVVQRSDERLIDSCWVNKSTRVLNTLFSAAKNKCRNYTTKKWLKFTFDFGFSIVAIFCVILCVIVVLT